MKSVAIGVLAVAVVISAAVWFNRPAVDLEDSVVQCRTKDGVELQLLVKVARKTGETVTAEQREQFNKIFREHISRYTEEQLHVPGTGQRISEEVLKEFLAQSHR
jgi:hypothetical protein